MGAAREIWQRDAGTGQGQTCPSGGFHIRPPDVPGRNAVRMPGAGGPPAGHILGSTSAPVSPRW